LTLIQTKSGLTARCLRILYRKGRLVKTNDPYGCKKMKAARERMPQFEPDIAVKLLSA
jgi:hypothetical protein